MLGVDKTEETPPDPGAPAQRIAYYPSWSVYGNALYPKTLDTNGTASRLTTLMYAFANIDPVNLTCMAGRPPGSSTASIWTGSSRRPRPGPATTTARRTPRTSPRCWPSSAASSTRSAARTGR
ncbi:hypothetical protein Apa02nite_086250 [Actinoplanes palleronii]|uniref:Uncharacterized protein n=1 Tax=Actinoplanes palleronii TaxID=113570 RepID=A0ABQ4BPA7_9ACTN|nr:hypothetical protein Apa02nite_086250 [Actinoplanes palleronii]